MQIWPYYLRLQFLQYCWNRSKVTLTQFDFIMAHNTRKPISSNYTDEGIQLTYILFDTTTQYSYLLRLHYGFPNYFFNVRLSFHRRLCVNIDTGHSSVGDEVRPPDIQVWYRAIGALRPVLEWRLHIVAATLSLCFHMIRSRVVNLRGACQMLQFGVGQKLS